MQSFNIARERGSRTPLIVTGYSGSGNDDDDEDVIPTSQLRVIHASHDAPPVKLKLDAAVALPNRAFTCPGLPAVGHYANAGAARLYLFGR